MTKTVTLKGILKHSDALQAIADANGDNRASGLPGYDASAAYVADKMRGAGYQVTVQPFDFPFFEEFGSTFQQTAPTPTTYVDGEDYDLMDFSGAGDVTARGGQRRPQPHPAARLHLRLRGGRLPGRVRREHRDRQDRARAARHLRVRRRRSPTPKLPARSARS